MGPMGHGHAQPGVKSRAALHRLLPTSLLHHPSPVPCPGVTRPWCKDTSWGPGRDTGLHYSVGCGSSFPRQQKGSGPQGGGVRRGFAQVQAGQEVPTAEAARGPRALSPVSTGLPQTTGSLTSASGTHVWRGVWGLWKAPYKCFFCCKNGFLFSIPFFSPETACVFISSTLTWETPWARRTAGT